MLSGTTFCFLIGWLYLCFITATISLIPLLYLICAFCASISLPCHKNISILNQSDISLWNCVGISIDHSEDAVVISAGLWITNNSNQFATSTLGAGNTNIELSCI